MILSHINLILLSLNVLGTALILLGKSYLGEKGKNLATKEDISAITQKIESVKEFYSKSLESYKFQLIREYDTVKPAINLMSKVDSELIELILNTNSLILEFRLDQTEDRAAPLQLAAQAEAKYLTQYYVRYGGLECANKIIRYNNVMFDFVRGCLTFFSYFDKMEVSISNKAATFLWGSCLFNRSCLIVSPKVVNLFLDIDRY